MIASRRFTQGGSPVRLAIPADNPAGVAVQGGGRAGRDTSWLDSDAVSLERSGGAPVMVAGRTVSVAVRAVTTWYGASPS